MYVLVYELHGQHLTIVCATKAIAKRELAELHKVGMATVWRMMDVTGWCGGSPDIWEKITHLPSQGHIQYMFR